MSTLTINVPFVAKHLRLYLYKSSKDEYFLFFWKDSALWKAEWNFLQKVTPVFLCPAMSENCSSDLDS